MAYASPKLSVLNKYVRPLPSFYHLLGFISSPFEREVFIS